MQYIFLRYFYWTYLIGAFLLGVRALSSLIFASCCTEDKFKNFITDLFVTVIWPLALFTPSGRRRLLQSLPFFKG